MSERHSFKLKKVKLRPLGKILHIVDGEAITHPDTHFIGKNAKVFTENDTEIGVLGDPFGGVDKPYQLVKLHNVDQVDIIGKNVFAYPRRPVRKRRRSRYQKRGKKNNSKARIAK